MSENRFLKDIVLLRNDTAVFDEIYVHAIQGNVDAQYALGLVYAEGRGVEEDLVRSFAWLSLCVKQGDADAETLRYIVGERMDEQQYLDTQSLLDELEKEIATNQQKETSAIIH